MNKDKKNPKHSPSVRPERRRTWRIGPFTLTALVLCAAVAYAHENGVIHRELKPANILFNAKGEAVVSDFGIAKILNFEMSLVPSGEIMGTIAYLAPEQRISSRSVSRRVDVYALGAILYETLTGTPPFADVTAARTR